MHDWEKSDSAIVAVKPPNKAGLPVAEAVEPRAGTKGNADQQSTYRTQSRKRVIQALSRVRQTTGSPSNTQGRSRMLELGSSGSVRGVSSNGHPYRDPPPEADISAVQSDRSAKPGGCGSVCFRPIVKPHRNRSWNKRPSAGLSASFKPASKLENRSPSAPSKQTEVDRR